MKRHFMMMASYNAWANNRLFDAAGVLSPEEWQRETGAFFKSMMATLNHLLASDRIWLKRMTGKGDAPNNLDAIIHRELDLLRAARLDEDRRIIEWIDSLSEDALRGRFSYLTISELRTVSQRLAPALAHLFNHQTHHRGQAHAILTTLGQPSISLDMIVFQRTPEGIRFA